MEVHILWTGERSPAVAYWRHGHWQSYGIGMGKHHESLLRFIDKVQEVKNKKAFIFSTSGMRRGKFFNRFDMALKGKLSEKGFDVVEEFSCLGLDTVGGLFKLVGGINRGRLNEKDLENAKKANFILKIC